MDMAEAQREVRHVFRGGFMGQFVSGLVWLASATAATYGSPRSGILLLVIGGFFIFPLTTLGLRLLGGPWRLSPENPLTGLGMQVAFVLPLSLPLVAAATMYRLEWFYPAFMIALGAHYLPFVFLYGMRVFAVLSFGLVGLGVALARAPSVSFASPAWISGGILVGFAVPQSATQPDPREELPACGGFAGARLRHLGRPPQNVFRTNRNIPPV